MQNPWIRNLLIGIGAILIYGTMIFIGWYTKTPLLKNDNFLEEYVEEVIEDHIGIDIDLTSED